MGSEIYGGPNRAVAAAKVGPPAIALMVVGGIGIVWHLFFLGLQMLGTGASMLSLPGIEDQEAAQRAFALMGGAIGIVISLVGLVVSALIIFGAMKMRGLQSWGLALTATLLAAVPGLTCHCCCLGLPGLPFAIWALIVLLDNNVKASFA